MKYFKNKKFNIPKFLFIFIGLLSCVGALYIQETLSYFYTSYGFANIFQTPALGLVAVYQKFTNPTPLYTSSGTNWKGKTCTKELFIENTSGENEASEYIRVACVQLMSPGSMFNPPHWYDGAYKIANKYGIEFNATDGFYNGYYGSSSMTVNSNWVKHGEWYYYKTPLSPGKKLKITDSLGKTALDNDENATMYRIYTIKFIVETLPTTVSDEEFQNAWGVSKSELGLS